MESYNLKKYEPGTSLVVQWLRLQAPSVWSLVRDLDSTCWNQEFKCFNRDGWSQVPQLRSWTVKCINKKNKKYEANICLMYQTYKVASKIKKNTWTNFKSSREQILKVVKIVNKNSQLKYIYNFSTIILIKYYFLRTILSIYLPWLRFFGVVLKSCLFLVSCWIYEHEVVQNFCLFFFLWLQNL